MALTLDIDNVQSLNKSNLPMLLFTHQDNCIKAHNTSINVLWTFSFKISMQVHQMVCAHWNNDQLPQVDHMVCHQPSSDCDSTVVSLYFLVGSIQPSHAWNVRDGECRRIVLTFPLWPFQVIQVEVTAVNKSLFPMRDEFLLNGAEVQIDFYAQSGGPKTEPRDVIFIALTV